MPTTALKDINNDTLPFLKKVLLTNSKMQLMQNDSLNIINRLDVLAKKKSLNAALRFIEM